MTDPVKTYNQSGAQQQPCCNCTTAGRTIWLPIERMHKRVRGNRVMYYCSGCWKQRQEALAKIGARK